MSGPRSGHCLVFKINSSARQGPSPRLIAMHTILGTDKKILLQNPESKICKQCRWGLYSWADFSCSMMDIIAPLYFVFLKYSDFQPDCIVLTA